MAIGSPSTESESNLYSVLTSSQMLCFPVTRIFYATCLASCLGLFNARNSAADERIDFNRDVRPLLSEHCFACHGFDESARQADLRLDTREGAMRDRGGYAAVTSGKPDQSELLDRIMTNDPERLMPPPDSHQQRLNEEEIETLRRWIEQGVAWGRHWAFEPPVSVPISEAGVHPIDYFVTRSLRDVDRDLSPAAAKHTLARRLAFDLTGLPPDPSAVDQLSENPTEAEWAEWIDGLLRSPQFGERMAMWWLDGARYSDTDGFQADATRQNWPWRDWVVEALNKDMPFDQFTIEQFAGDLLPNATDENRLATCFHRNHMHNGEGGRDPAESRVDYVLDRTNTMGTLWLGLTLGCTQCHDHKFDPISQKDYYGLTAYFNSIDEDGKAGGGAKPFLKYRSRFAGQAIEEAEQFARQTGKSLEDVRSVAEREFEKTLPKRIEEASGEFKPWLDAPIIGLRSSEGTELRVDQDGTIRSGENQNVQDDFFITIGKGPLERITGIRLEVFADMQHTDAKYSYSETGEFILTNIKLQLRSKGSSELVDLSLKKAVASSEGQGNDTKYGRAAGTLDDDPRTGWTTRTKPVEPVQVIVFELDQPLVLRGDQELDIVLMQRSLAPRELIGRFRLSVTDQRGKAVRSLDPMPMERLASAVASHESEGSEGFQVHDIEKDLRADLLSQFLEDHPGWQAASKRDATASRQLSEAKKAGGDLNVTILAERDEPRQTHVLIRGVWNQHGDSVAPSLLTALSENPESTEYEVAEAPTRLELARWIVSRDNPLTARVITNQVWQLFWGAGLVRTPNDFGLRGELPTHPELLDWLAVDFMDHNWNLKHLIRRIVTSRTYQQSSVVSPELLELDPDNRWLARGARFRLPSWMIRDASLKYSGLLNPMVGGPPMFAYQPPGIWQDQFMGRFTYQPSLGPSQYRRTLYNFWRRSSAPTFLFDSAMRRTCEVTPRRTNTPLHALTLLNDTTSLESARSLAEKSLDADSVVSSTEQLKRLFKSVLCRLPNEAELEVLNREYERSARYYADNSAAATTLTTVGQLEPPEQSRAANLAATMIVANLILNLDETITHE